jgi:hypothetical protein
MSAVARLRHFFPIVALSALVGALVILNQLGPALEPYAPISSLRPVWEVNATIGYMSYLWLVSVLLTLAALCYAGLAHNSQIQRAYGIGVITGAVALPSIVLAAMVIGGAVWLLFMLGGFVFSILAVIAEWIRAAAFFVLTPVRWLWTNVMEPIIVFVTTPLQWVWENWLSPAFQIFIPLLSWIKHTILLPILDLAVRYILKPLFIVALGVVGSGLVLAPFVAVGLAVLGGFKTSFKGPLTPQGAFEQGVGVGFICLDAVAMAILAAYGYSSEPPLFLIVSVVVPAVYFVRLMPGRPELSALRWNAIAFRERLRMYWANAKLEAIVPCVMLPIAIVLVVLQQSGDE